MLSMASLTLFGHQLNMPANPGLISWGFSFLGSWGLYACNYVELNFVFFKKKSGAKEDNDQTSPHQADNDSHEEGDHDGDEREVEVADLVDD